MEKAVIYTWQTSVVREYTLYFHREHFDPIIVGALETLDRTGHWEHINFLHTQLEQANLVDTIELPEDARCKVCGHVIRTPNAGPPPIDE